jgi:hypothetical protein
MSVTFRGGEKLQAKLAELIAISAKPVSVQVGFLPGSTCGEGGKSSAPFVAQILEYGHLIPVGRSGQAGPQMQVPPRPFFSGMIADNEGGWPGQMGQAMVQAQYNGERTMEIMGDLIKKQLVQAIDDFTDPGNAPSTLKKKAGRGKVLIDSGGMRDAVDYKVNGGSE